MGRRGTAAGAGVGAGLVALPARTAVQQLRLLLTLSQTLASTRTVEEVSHAVGTVARTFFGALFGGVAVVESNRTQMRYLDLSGLPASVRQLWTFPLASSRPSAIVARTNRVLFIESVTDAGTLDAVAARAAHESGGEALAYLPMRLADRVVGTIALMWTHPVSFDQKDEALLTALAGYAAQALDRAQLLADRQQVAQVLQEALLPTMPTIDGVELAAVYRPANADDAVGGDWYDAFATTAPATADGQESFSSGREQLTVVIGDVTGHDSQAAAYMGRIQAKLRALALDAPGPPDRLLERLEQVLDVTPRHRLVTAVVAQLTPTSDGTMRLCWSNAGHPPPLLLAPGHPVRYLTDTPQPLLGLTRPACRTASETDLPPGSTLLLFTDGLCERRDEDFDDGLKRLADVVEHHRQLLLPELVQTVVEQQTAGYRGDDTALLGLTTTRARA